MFKRRFLIGISAVLLLSSLAVGALAQGLGIPHLPPVFPAETILGIPHLPLVFPAETISGDELLLGDTTAEDSPVTVIDSRMTTPLDADTPTSEDVVVDGTAAADTRDDRAADTPTSEDVVVDGTPTFVETGEKPSPDQVQWPLLLQP